MFYERSDLIHGLDELRKKFGRWNPEDLALVSIGENHLVEGKNFLGWLRTSDPVQNAILDVLEQYVLKSESIGVNSGIDIVKNVFSGKKIKDINTLEYEMSSSRYPRTGDFEKMILDLFDEKYRELLLTVLKNAETDGNIFLKREHVVKTVLEKMDGYVFNLDSPIKKMNFDERNVKCFIVDGFIESVGEIHHILEDLSKNNVPGIVFARNFANDVVTTIQHNKAIGRMNVLPIQVRFDLEELNTLVDIAMISAGDLVSSDKGDLIRAIATDSVPYLERVMFKNGKLVMINTRTSKTVKQHLNNLRIRAADADEVRRKMLEGRMATLSTNCLKISIPIGKQHDDVESVLDSFLRLVRTCLLHGVVSVDGSVIPVTTYVASNVFTRRFEKMMMENLAGAMLA